MKHMAQRRSDEWLGRRLARDVFNAGGILLLHAMHRITEEDVDKLELHGLRLTNGDFLADDGERATLEAVEQAIGHTERLFRQVREEGQIPVLELRRRVLPAIRQAADEVPVYTLLSSLRAKENDLYRHSVAVAAISAVVGRWLDLPPQEQHILTIGALLHDVGKMKVSESILHGDKGRLSDVELQTLRKHTVFGFELLSATPGLSRRSALIALQHHERDDGGGYPLGLAGERIDPLSRIVALAEALDRAISDSAASFHSVLARLHNGSFGRFDRRLLIAISRKLLNALVGSKVELSDGRVGRVVWNNPGDPSAPLVMIGEEFVDLSVDRRIRMRHVCG